MLNSEKSVNLKIDFLTEGQCPISNLKQNKEY